MPNITDRPSKTMEQILQEHKELDAILVKFQGAFAKKRKVTVTLKPGYLIQENEQYADAIVDAPKIKDQIKLQVYVHRLKQKEAWLYKATKGQSKLPLAKQECFKVIVPYSSIDSVVYKQ